MTELSDVAAGEGPQEQVLFDGHQGVANVRCTRTISGNSIDQEHAQPRDSIVGLQSTDSACDEEESVMTELSDVTAGEGPQEQVLFDGHQGVAHVQCTRTISDNSIDQEHAQPRDSIVGLQSTDSACDEEESAMTELSDVTAGEGPQEQVLFDGHQGVPNAHGNSFAIESTVSNADEVNSTMSPQTPLPQKPTENSVAPHLTGACHHSCSLGVEPEATMWPDTQRTVLQELPNEFALPIGLSVQEKESLMDLSTWLSLDTAKDHFTESQASPNAAPHKTQIESSTAAAMVDFALFLGSEVEALKLSLQGAVDQQKSDLSVQLAIFHQDDSIRSDAGFEESCSQGNDSWLSTADTPPKSTEDPGPRPKLELLTWTLDECKQKLAQAIADEDFERATLIKKRRDLLKR